MADTLVGTEQISGTLGLNNMTGNIGGAMHTLVIAAFWFFIIALLIILFLVIRYLLSYNIVAVIEEKLEFGTPLIRVSRAKIKYLKNKDGNNPVPRIYLMGSKKSIMPPNYHEVLKTLEEKDKIAIYKLAGIDPYANLRDLFISLSEADREKLAKEYFIPIETKYDDLTTKQKNDLRDAVDLPLPKDFTEEEVKRLYTSIWGISKKGKKTIRIFKHGEDMSIVPWNNTETERYLLISHPTRRLWGNEEFREGLELFKPKESFWEKYGHLVMWMGSFVLITIIFIFLFNKFDTLKDLSTAFDNHAAAMNNLATAMNNYNSQKIV